MCRVIRLLCCMALSMSLVPVPASAVGAGNAGAYAPARAGDAAARPLPRSAPVAPVAAAAPAAFALAAVAPDVFEVDEAIPRPCSDASLPLTENRTIHSATPGGADWDRYQLTGSANCLYTFETTGAADTVIRMQDSDTSEVLGWYDDKGDGSVGSKAYWRCPTDGKRVDVWVGPANSATGAGAYEISIVGAPGADRPGVAQRLYGASKNVTAVNLAMEVFRDAGGSPWRYYEDGVLRNVSRVIVVSGDSRAYLSAMIAQPLARVFNAPILLTSKYHVPSSTSAAIKSIRANNGGGVKIYIVGPNSWVSSGVYRKLKSLRGTGTIERISGSDRYALAALVADRVDGMWVRNRGEHPAGVIVANGSSTKALTDLLGISALSYRMGWPILLTKPSDLPHATYYRVRKGRFKRSTVIVPNSRTYVTPATYKRASGDRRLSSHSDRTASALDIARSQIGLYWCVHDGVVVVNHYMEALTAGTYAGAFRRPILVSGVAGPSEVTAGYFTARPSMVGTVTVVGSSTRVSDQGLAAFQALLR